MASSGWVIRYSQSRFGGALNGNKGERSVPLASENVPPHSARSKILIKHVNKFARIKCLNISYQLSSSLGSPGESWSRQSGTLPTWCSLETASLEGLSRHSSWHRRSRSGRVPRQSVSQVTSRQFTIIESSASTENSLERSRTCRRRGFRASGQ